MLYRTAEQMEGKNNFVIIKLHLIFGSSNSIYVWLFAITMELHLGLPQCNSIENSFQNTRNRNAFAVVTIACISKGK